MKKIVTIALLVLALGLFAACGLLGSDDDVAVIADDEQADDQQEDTPEAEEETAPRGEEWQGGIVRGFWEDNTYINEYLNLRFVAPHDWVVATEEEMAQIMGVGADILGRDLDENFWDAVADSALVDMMVSEPFGSVSVQIIVERLIFPMTRLSTEDYVQRLASEFESDFGEDAQVHVVPGTTRIGDYDWYSVRVQIEMFDVTVALTYFINVLDGYARAIMVTYGMAEGVLDFVLAGFSSLSDPAPPPAPPPEPPAPAEPVDQAVVGRWVWDANEGYAYEFLADGTGRRGWYPELDNFTWSTTAADNHLMMHFGFLQESWTYTIVGDVMTLDSRQEIGMTYSYVRWDGDFVAAEDIDLTGHPLVGRWAWDQDSSYIYIFEDDGTGTRGFAGNRYDIYWVAYDEYLFMDVGTMVEEWVFEIVDGVLTIVSLQAADLTWSYIRQE
ncbi:MAG: hypothetical protein FWC73_00465 [Defluviitaleaceae bacterium]|nr:hypothetical protein [Defluviitaleaceae bacterium]